MVPGKFSEYAINGLERSTFVCRQDKLYAKFSEQVGGIAEDKMDKTQIYCVNDG